MVVERVMGLGLLVWRDTHIKLKQITGRVLGFSLKWRTLTGRIYVFGKSRHTHMASYAVASILSGPDRLLMLILVRKYI